MDKLSGLASKLGGKGSSSHSGSNSGGQGQEDYVDKGMYTVPRKPSDSEAYQP